MNEDDPQRRIEYRNWTDDRFLRRQNAMGFLLGMVPGIFVVTVFGCFNFRLNLYPSSSPTHNYAMVPIFGSIAIAAGVLGAVMLRGPRRRFLLAGFLLGIALTCLIEGICFFG